MPPSPLKAIPNPSLEPEVQAANEDLFEPVKTSQPIETIGDTCIETLNQEEVTTLFKKRKAVTWLSRNGPEAVREANKTVLAGIMATMKRYSISEDEYLKYERGEGEMID